MIKTFKLETAATRLCLAITLIICLGAFLVFAKWCFANAIAARAPAVEVAELAVSMAPNDPQTRYAAAVLNEKTFVAENFPKSLAEFEQAVALAPNDFRLWLAYGKARERNGDAEGAELALRRALVLAPNYAEVQWTLGNTLLRGDKIEEAFAEIRRAAESNPAYQMPAITTASAIFEGNIADVKRYIGGSAILNANLAVFLADRKQFEEAVELWNSLPGEDKRTTHKTIGEQLYAKLAAAKKYRFALQIQRDLSEPAAAGQFAVGKIYNGDFERDIERGKPNIFDWQVADAAQPQIGLNAEQKRGGDRSVFIIFNSSDGKDFRSFAQTIAVEPAKKYVFGGFYKSNLKTAATLLWEIADAADGKVLATTKAIAANADWSDLRMEFTVPENVEGVVLRLAREPCKNSICPITGYVWFDDFSISQ